MSVRKPTLKAAMMVGLFKIAEAAATGIGSVSDAATLVAWTDVAAALSWVTGAEACGAHDEAPAVDVWPLEQPEHEPEWVPPVLERYLPAAHAMQLVEVCELADW
jgi:hypothetical protein